MSVFRLAQTLLAIALIYAGPTAAASFSVGGAGCQFASIQAAIDQAALTPEADVIRIANNASYHFQALRKLDPHPLSLVGGFPSCFPASVPNGQTRIDGSGLDSSVLSILGGEVEIANIEITGGAPRHGRGGGVYIGSPTRKVEFHNVRITANSAEEGGGLAIVGAPNNTISIFSERLVIDHNFGALAGGGMWATYAQSLKLSATWLVASNQTGGDGGGAWLGYNSVFHLFSSKYPGGFVDNLAKGNGGGVALVGGGLALFHSGGPAQVTEISRNSAARGGGVYLYGAAAGATSLQTHGVIGNDNRALLEGGFAAIRMVGDDSSSRFGELQIDASYHFGGAPCADPLGCNIFRGNVAMASDGQLQPGALISIRNEGKAAVGYGRFWNTTIRENLGHDLVHHWSNAKSGYAEEIDFRESLVVRNLVEKHLIETEGDGSVYIFGSTFAGNESGAATLQIDAATSLAYISGSIFDDRANLIDQVPPNQSLFALMVRAPGATDGMPLIFRDDPLFEDANSDDYRLRASSPALDRQWDLVPGGPLDRAGNLRSVDLAAVPDFNTPRDLGCFEHP
jgi:hypothetical protein